ncbi:hypothetical protein [Acidocella aminolytica]|uniref:Uncharacterized protein n=1 Tax=Acidocella aminolytica 101 = DSM 11237 TaxID=1120923 RepID=A0A0D6PEK2_9PROT|nr:hypothetical protein [Acidocella aminolytica]GAN79781.1 hypothetical protein Aam_030_014 [Acidocella aminolytica 101 = DSM 11237]GBQ32037.1 hypothetical protein AA11237_0049 [Acidocella aminolytica 101 = DSM 11237]SHF35696.1 hypothetical protein SAMN02746095_02951 [Acidocella aminolytica 101 = DSM 11237]
MAVGANQPFKGVDSQAIACTGAPANAALPGSGESVLIYNAGTVVAFVLFGGNAASVSEPQTYGLAIPPGGSRLLGVSKFDNFIGAAFAADGTGTGTLYVSRGSGTVY